MTGHGDAQPELDEKLKELGDMAERVVKDTLDDVERAYQRGRQSAFLDAREALLAAGGTGEREHYRAAIERAIERLEKFDYKGPKQVGRALMGLEDALASPSPVSPAGREEQTDQRSRNG